MNRNFLLILLILSSFSFARQEKMPPSYFLNAFSKKEIPTYALPSIDTKKLIKLDTKKQSSNRKPVQIATPNKVDITPYTHGAWVDVPGGKLWKLRFLSKGATDISFGFTDFYLPKGVELYLLSHMDDRYYDGPYTFLDNRSYRQFWTAALPGGDVAIEMFVPNKVQTQIDLRLTNVATGFRDIFQRFGGTGLNVKAGSCNNNVVCPEANEWRDEIRSVAHYSFQAAAGGTFVCTGSLVMDADKSFKPYFLTAKHCDPVPASVVTYWNYENINCSDPVNGSTRSSVTQTISGSVVRAERVDVDMQLLELSSVPPSEFNPHWAGWDRSGNAPSGSVGIHHPAGDEKVISFNNDALTTVNSCIGTGGSNTHWLVDNWEDGTTEGGSSGSGIWDPVSHQLVGFLSGGSASCSNPAGDDCYGKFSVAWSDGSANNSSQLKPWLDPSNTGIMSIDGSDRSDFDLTAVIQSIEVCSSQDAVYNLDLTRNNQSFTETVTLKTLGLPTEIQSNFSVSSLVPPGSSVLTLSNLSAIAPDIYDFNVTAESSASTRTTNLKLIISSGSLTPLTLSSPSHSNQSVDTLPTFEWQASSGASSYLLEVSSDESFSSVVISETVSTTSYTHTAELQSGTTYYWRVTPSNSCITGEASSVFMFTTSDKICVAPNQFITDNSAAGIDVILNSNSKGGILDLKVSVMSNHSYPGDLIFTLSHDSVSTVLMDRPGVPSNEFGCGTDEINVTFDDSSDIDVETFCNDNSPGISSVLKPQSPLSVFNNMSLNGEWILNVSDNSSIDSGSLQRFCLIPTVDLISADGFE